MTWLPRALWIGVVLVAVLPGHAADDPAAAKAPDLPLSVEALLAEFRAVDWRLKPERGDPAPETWKLRIRTEWALASLGAEYVPALSRLVRDEGRFVRTLAAKALGAIAGPGGTPALAAALAEETDNVTRIAIVEALGRTGGKGALDAVEAQQKPGLAKEFQFAIGLARRQLRGKRWDVESIREEYREAVRTEIESAEMGEMAPELSLPSVAGPVNLSLFEGRVVVLVFCQGDPSVKDAKILTRLSGKRDKLKQWDVEVVVVDCHEKERTGLWADRMHLPFTFAADPSGRAQAAYGVARQLVFGGEWLPSPAWFVLNRRGEIVWKRVGRKVGDHAVLGELLPVLDQVSLGRTLR